MADILKELASYLSVKKIDSDNNTFKLFSKASVCLCILGSVLCAATQYFGHPIICDHKGVDGEIAKAYCWIHGSSFIPDKFDEHFDCITDQTKVTRDSDTSYYQWVVFMLLVHAILFLIPHHIWKWVEGGLMTQFAAEDAKSALILADDDKLKDLVKKYVKNFMCVKHDNNAYFCKFVLCEMANFVALVCNFVVADKFLDGQFVTYGSDVMNYYSYDYHVRKQVMVNPMCNTFPTKVSCEVRGVGAGGGRQSINGLCILSQNIINEKIYLVLWFWFVTLFVVSGLALIVRLCTIFVPAYRRLSLLSHLHVRITGSSRTTEMVGALLRQSSVGDWFFLKQLARNCNPYFFREFLIALCEDMQLDQSNGGNGMLLKGRMADDHDLDLS